MSEDLDQNIDEATVDRLLLERKQNALPKELKGLLTICVEAVYSANKVP